MTVLDCKRTNIFGDTEVSGRNPDAEGDFYHVTDGQQDANYMDCVLADIPSILSNDPAEEFMILYGGVVSDGGSGTIDISAGVAKGKDSDGNRKLIYIPALTGVTLPSGWNDDRQIWVTLKYDFKLSSATRTHRAGTSYHYQIENTYLGDSNGENSTGSSDLFTDSDPTGTAVILGSFKMNGTTYSDQSVRTLTFNESFLEKIFPVGSVVPQFPAAASNTESVAFPVADRPATKYGGTWTEIFTSDDAFFKVGTTDHQLRIDGLSPDQMQLLTGTFSLKDNDISAYGYFDTVTGVFSGSTANSASTISSNGDYSTLNVVHTVSFSSANSSNARTSSTTSGVTEPRNYRMKIWKRTA